jgi:cell division protein FtsQ
MNRLVRHLLALVLTAVCIAGLLVVLRASAMQRHQVLCGAVSVTVTDSLERRFVTEKDVKEYLADYGEYIGQRIDSVDLNRIERLIEGRSAIRGCEAYVTGDGVLHLEVTQREPVVRFQTGGNGYYADAQGFIFPLQRNDAARVPVIDGAVPLKIARGFKGEPTDEAERRWLGEALRLVGYMDRNKAWNSFFSQITVLPGGDMVLVPAKGRERFTIGPARDLDAKFERIRTYYEAVVPAGEPDRYGSVNVKFDKQIICKK